MNREDAINRWRYYLAELTKVRTYLEECQAHVDVLTNAERKAYSEIPIVKELYDLKEHEGKKKKKK